MYEKYGDCENIIIKGCILHSRDSALKIGTETWGNIRQVIMSDCIIKDCSRAVGIWSRDGGTISDIYICLLYTSSYLSQLIKIKLGKNFMDLLFDTRMSKACEFLKDPEVKIYNISEMVGYTNPNNFTRAFKARYGQSPKEYRMENRGRV